MLKDGLHIGLELDDDMGDQDVFGRMGTGMEIESEGNGDSEGNGSPG